MERYEDLAKFIVAVERTHTFDNQPSGNYQQVTTEGRNPSEYEPIIEATDLQEG